MRSRRDDTYKWAESEVIRLLCHRGISKSKNDKTCSKEMQQTTSSVHMLRKIERIEFFNRVVFRGVVHSTGCLGPEQLSPCEKKNQSKKKQKKESHQEMKCKKKNASKHYSIFIYIFFSTKKKVKNFLKINTSFSLKKVFLSLPLLFLRFFLDFLIRYKC